VLNKRQTADGKFHRAKSPEDLFFLQGLCEGYDTIFTLVEDLVATYEAEDE
tara:strand:- start:329 stop:481 length:153 start_codon:yes stop_codon:yes gene_type:complete